MRSGLSALQQDVFGFVLPSEDHSGVWSRKDIEAEEPRALHWGKWLKQWDEVIVQKVQRTISETNDEKENICCACEHTLRRSALSLPAFNSISSGR
jgi:hypothetical protein